MNAKQTYLAWVRQTHPQVYWTALRRVLTPASGLSGLGDDLTATVNPNLATVSIDTSGVSDIPSDISASIDQANQSQGSSSDWSSFFNAVANSISSIGSTVVQTQAQQNLLQINTQRAKQGLAPLTASGVPVTTLAPTSSSVAQFEANLSQSMGWLLPALGVGAVAVLLMARARR